jgi:hypothetical protein
MVSPRIKYVQHGTLLNIGKAVLRRSNSAAPAPCQLLWPFTAEALVDDSMVRCARENFRTRDIVRKTGRDLEALNGRQRVCSERVMELYRQQLRGVGARVRGIRPPRDLLSGI